MAKISKRAMSVPASATMAVAARAKELKAEGRDVIGFGAGEPDFDTPQYIKDAAIKALNEGKTGYTATPGIPQLRTAIADKLKKENGLDYAMAQIIVNIGAKHTVYTAIQAIIDDGDEVIVPTPYWVTYPEAVKLAGGVFVPVKTSKQSGYKILPEQLKAAITDKTAMFLLNSPSNPGGFTYTPDELAALAKVLEGTNIMVLSDEIYERLVYNGTEFKSFAAISKDAYDRTVTVNGFSKAYAMTGWRVGYAAGPKDVIAAMTRLQSHMTQNPVNFVQYGALAAFDDKENVVEQMREQFEKRAMYMCERLNAIEGVTCDQPTGAFYCFPDVSSYYGKSIGGNIINDSMDFAKNLLEQANVALVPGGPFGCDNNVRLSFACSMDNIKEGIDRLEKWLSS
jgi:aspartate aminotransferase